MGSEHLRYQRLAEADAVVAAHPGSLPLLPLGDLRADEAVAVALFDDLVERVANPTNLYWDTDIYIPIVELLDRQPVLIRAMIGRKMMQTLLAVRADGRRRGFIAGNALSEDRLVFAYDVGPETVPDDDEGLTAEVAVYGCVRHAEALETGAATTSRALAIGVRHSEIRGRRYAFALFNGPPPTIDAALRQAIESDYGRTTHSVG